VSPARTAALLLLSVAACGGGGGGGGGGGPTQPQPGIVYASATAGNNSLAFSGNAGATTTLRLDLTATQLSGVYGLGFDLVFPDSLLAYSSSTEGTFFAGTGTTFQVKESEPGRLVVGISRLGAVSGVSGSGTVLTLVFTSRGTAGSGSISFQKNSAFNSSGGPISGINWAGGTVTVTP
jgi:hypothetical protein